VGIRRRRPGRLGAPNQLHLRQSVESLLRSSTVAFLLRPACALVPCYIPVSAKWLHHHPPCAHQHRAGGRSGRNHQAESPGAERTRVRFREGRQPSRRPPSALWDDVDRRCWLLPSLLSVWPPAPQRPPGLPARRTITAPPSSGAFISSASWEVAARAAGKLPAEVHQAEAAVPKPPAEELRRRVAVLRVWGVAPKRVAVAARPLVVVAEALMSPRPRRSSSAHPWRFRGPRRRSS